MNEVRKDMNGKRTIDYLELGRRISEMNQEIAQGIADDLGQDEKNWRRTIEIHDVNSGLHDPVELGVNWGAIGTMDPKTTAVFGKWLVKAGEMAEASDLNGVFETYD